MKRMTFVFGLAAMLALPACDAEPATEVVTEEGAGVEGLGVEPVEGEGALAEGERIEEEGEAVAGRGEGSVAGEGE